MRISLVVSAMFAAICAMFSAQPALANPYPAPAPTLVVSIGTVTVNQTVQVTGRGYGAGEAVAIAVAHSSYGVVSASAHGQFTTAVRLTKVGTIKITATGKSSGRSASVVVTVLAKGAPPAGYVPPPAGYVPPPMGHMAPAPGGALPVTSAARFDVPATVAVGGTATLIGVGLVLLSARRRRRQASDTVA